MKFPDPDVPQRQLFWAPVEEYPEGIGSEIRMNLLQHHALTQLFAVLPNDITATRLLLVNMQPDPRISNAETLAEVDRITTLQTIHPGLQSATIRLAPVADGAAAALQQATTELQQGQWDMIVFGGADSLVDKNTLLQLATQKLCCTDRNSDRMLPGEGAAYLLIKPVSQQHPGMAEIRGIDHAMEPNTGCAASRRTAGLAQAVEAALPQADQAPGRLDSIIVGHTTDEPGALEWHQTERHLWRKEGLMPEQIEEWNPQLFLGFPGAAALPLALVLGCARFDFNFPPAANVLICEAGLSPPRGAICLRAPLTGSPERRT